MKTTFLSAAFFLASAAGLRAASPPMITKQPEPATFAKSATGRFYVSAASTDGGYLTYQWRRSGPFTDTVADPNGAGKSAILYDASAATIPEGTSATLTTTTPADSGYYYYWAEITNTKDGETAAIQSAIVQAKVVNRTLQSEIVNGGFEQFEAYGVATVDNTWPRSKFPYRWETTHDGRVISGGNGQITSNINLYNHKIWRDDLTETADDKYSVELNCYYPSTLYQEVATVPGKIYEWQFQHATRKNVTGKQDAAALIIGPAINDESEYGVYDNSETNFWKKGNDLALDNTTTIEKVLAPSSGTVTTVGDNAGATYTYGTNIYTQFSAVVDALAKKYSTTTGNLGTDANYRNKSHVVTYKGKQYFVFIASTPHASKFFTYQGAYSVPQGQGTTVFGWVAVSWTNNVQDGNLINDVSFASGSPVSSEQEVSFTSEAQLTAATKPGYAYGLAEVRGSTATPIVGSAAAYYDADGAGADSSEAPITADASGWYIQTTFDTTGVITFKNLTPGKVYRIVGIPAAAISPALNVNERPEYVLDEGYYANMRILPVNAGDTATVWNIDLEAVGMKARATIKNARSDVEYALLDSVDGSVALAHAWTNWTTSDSKGRVRFDNLTLDTVYYLVVRPLGYGEVTYAEAAEAAVKIRTPNHPDLSVAHIARPTYTTITIDSTSSGYDYAAVDTKTGEIVEQKQGLDHTKLRFENLHESKAYQMIIRRAGGSWLKGVRVYPYPSRLYIDYVNETIRSSADSTGNIPVNVEYRIQRKKR